MFTLLLPLLLVIGIAFAVRAATHHPHAGQPSELQPQAPAAAPVPATSAATPTAGAPPAPATPLQAALLGWTSAGIITTEQATAIEAYEAAAVPAPSPSRTAPRARRFPVVAEALGYLGGTLGIVGLVLLISRYWADLGTPARLALTAAGTVGLTVAGYLVRELVDPALARLRWFLWFLASAALVAFGVVLAGDALGADAAHTIVLTCAALVTMQNLAFWWGRDRPVQQLLCLAGSMVTVGTVVAQFATAGPSGIAVWAAGCALLLVGLRESTTLPPLTVAVGAAATLTGAILTVGEWRGPGLLFVLLTALGLLALPAVPSRPMNATTRVVLTVIGAVGMAQGAPSTIGFFAEQAGVLTGLVVWLTGAGLLVLAARELVRAPVTVEVIGGIAVVAGAAVTGTQSVPFATLFGIASAIGLIVLGTQPGRVLLSLFGSVGLLINVPWTIRYFFPGEGRVPLLILASGAVIVAVAVWLARMGDRFTHELHFHYHHR